MVRSQFESAPELLDSCQVYPEVLGNLILPCCAPCSLGFAVLLCMLTWRNAEAELDKNRFLGDEGE